MCNPRVFNFRPVFETRRGRHRRTPLNAAWVFLTAAALIAGASAQAQDCPSAQRHRISNRVPLIRNMVDPNPIAGDFELPMPCGGKLILRHVCVPADSFLQDFRYAAGCTDCGRKTTAFMEARRPVHLAGAFTRADLPAGWQQKLADMSAQGDGRCPAPAEAADAPVYFFIGKYEISRFQWDAVMESDCPGWDRLVTPDDPRPKTEISWFDAVNFTRRYTEWLLAEHPEILPRFSDGRFGHLRLPTEAEWEYAARGGHRVTVAQLNQEAIFPLRGRPLSDYAVYTTVNAPKPPEKIAWIGSKCANPLGLFDTAGNVAEMMMEPFRFSVDSRLHGTAGGFLIKGGSFRKRRPEILPGRREEMPYFLENGAFRSADVGFRVVLSGIATPRDRLERLKTEWRRRSPEDAPTGSAASLPEDEGGTASPAARTEPDAPAVPAVLWRALFSAETILTHARKIREIQEKLGTLEGLDGTAIPEVELMTLRLRRRELEKALAREQAAANRFLSAYLSALQGLQAAPAPVLAERIEDIVENWAGGPSADSTLIRYLEIIQRQMRSLPSSPSLEEQDRLLWELVSYFD